MNASSLRALVRCVTQLVAADPTRVLRERGVRRIVLPAWVALLVLAAIISPVFVEARVFAGPREQPQLPPASPTTTADAPAPEERKDREGFPLPAEAVARVGSARLRHGRLPANLTYSPDGKVLASSGGGQIRLWDAGTGKLLRRIQVAVDGQRIRDGLFSADGKTVLALDGETCRWFDVETGKEVRRCDVQYPRTMSHACFAPHGEMIAVAGTAPSKDLVVYDLPSGKERFRRTAEQSWRWQLAFSPDGKTLATMDGEGKPPFKQQRVRLFDTTAGKLLGEFDAGETSYGLTFAPDGKKLLGHNLLRKLCVWSVPAGEPLHRIELPFTRLATTAFSPDGTSVVVTSATGDHSGLDTHVIELATGKELRGFRTYPVSIALAFSPDGKTLAVGIGSGVISQWEFATGKRLAASADAIAPFGPLQFNEAGKLLWVTSDTFAAIDWQSGREVRRLRVPHEGPSWVLALSPDRCRVAGVNAAQEPVVWDAASGRELCVLPITAGRTMRAFSSDGRTLYTGEWEGPVRAWDVNTGKERPPLDKELRRVTGSLAVSPDGHWLAAADFPNAVGGSRREVTVWDLRTRREAHRLLAPLAGAFATGLAFSPDGTLLAAVGNTRAGLPDPDGVLMVWDLRTGKERACRTGLTAMHAVAFSADSRLLATGGFDGTLCLWEVATGQQRYRFTGHESTVFGIAFSPDSKLLASASADAPVFIWDVSGSYNRPIAAIGLTQEEKNRIWESLADADAALAFKAMRQLLARPGPAAAFLVGRLKPIAPADRTVVEQRISDLDAADFAVREKANAELAKVVDQAEPLLRKALKTAPSAEAKRQIEGLLDGIETLSAERLRELRALEVLERLDTAEARKLLGEIAGGAKNARLTNDAKAAIGRMNKPKPAPVLDAGRGSRPGK